MWEHAPLSEVWIPLLSQIARLDDDSKMLGYYGVEPGMNIHVIDEVRSKGRGRCLRKESAIPRDGRKRRRRRSGSTLAILCVVNGVGCSRSPWRQDPFSLSRNGGLDDVSNVKKYRMSEEEYDKRSGTLREWIKKEKQKVRGRVIGLRYAGRWARR